ncbi:hypothetical protein [Nocardiopsis sp. CNT312]|uniref:hypothetical protein n=1 Tax=Nocardiopsis sp. CNT312 TaxID=1137268 RepID=UPI0012DE0611|nr:hypothetical protein [Nocardiopsis sp. CNT312]
MRTHTKEEGADHPTAARHPMATTLGPRRHVPHQRQDTHEHTDREPVVLADALGEVIAALGGPPPEPAEPSLPR